jgi:hypothetical protein
MLSILNEPQLAVKYPHDCGEKKPSTTQISFDVYPPVETKPPPIYCNISSAPEGQGDVQDKRNNAREPEPDIFCKKPRELILLPDGAPDLSEVRSLAMTREHNTYGRGGEVHVRWPAVHRKGYHHAENDGEPYSAYNGRGGY